MAERMNPHARKRFPVFKKQPNVALAILFSITQDAISTLTFG
jgi:hypothetical protein